MTALQAEPRTHRPAQPQPTQTRSADTGAMASVSKALLLLDSFHDADTELGVSELARRAGVPKSTAFRLLVHLEESGYLERVDRSYRLGWRLFELGNDVAACRPNGLRDIAMPHLVDLHSATSHTVHLAVLEGHDVVYLEKVHGARSVDTPAAVGKRRAASLTAVGKALLAFSGADIIREVLSQPLPVATQYSITQPGRLLEQLRTTRRLHIAHDREESTLGLTCVASPVIVNGRAVAAVSVATGTCQPPTQQTTLLVRRAAAQIASALPNQLD